MGFLLSLQRGEESPSLMLLVGNKEGCLKIKILPPMSSSHHFLGLVTQSKMTLSVSTDSSPGRQVAGTSDLACWAFPVKLQTFLDLLTLQCTNITFFPFLFPSHSSPCALSFVPTAKGSLIWCNLHWQGGGRLEEKQIIEEFKRFSLDSSNTVGMIFQYSAEFLGQI